MGFIVVSLPCTAYQCGSLIVFCKGRAVGCVASNSASPQAGCKNHCGKVVLLRAERCKMSEQLPQSSILRRSSDCKTETQFFYNLNLPGCTFCFRKTIALCPAPERIKISDSFSKKQLSKKLSVVQKYSSRHFSMLINCILMPPYLSVPCAVPGG